MIKSILRKAMTWDVAKPSGSQKLRLSDEEIRANWSALMDALAREHIFPGTQGVDAGIHKASVDTANPAGYEGRIAITNNVLWWYSNSTWRTLIPVGTKMAFFQAAVPTGWTQDTSQNDKVMRVVSGTGGGYGGTWALSGMSTGKPTADVGTHVVNYGTQSYTLVDANHVHHLATDDTWRPAYVDVVIGTKD
jgi:hypothetical protein